MHLDKPRPAVVLSVDQLNRHALDVCVVGITTKEHFDCWVKCDQVTTLEKNLLRYPALGTLPIESMGKIEEQVKIALGLL